MFEFKYKRDPHDTIGNMQASIVYYSGGFCQMQLKINSACFEGVFYHRALRNSIANTLALSNIAT